MSDLISRQAAIDLLKKAYWNNDIQSAKDDPCIIDAMIDWAIRQIKSVPAIEAKPVKHGRWLSYDDTEQFAARCSLCGNWIDTRFGKKYCPHCGAKMDEVEE